MLYFDIQNDLYLLLQVYRLSELLCVIVTVDIIRAKAFCLLAFAVFGGSIIELYGVFNCFFISIISGC